MNDELDKNNKYLIKIWETEELRDSGESDILETNITDLSYAIKKLKEIMEENNYASAEVQSEDEKKTIYYCTPKEEKYYYNFQNIELKERIDKIVELYFIENNLSNLMDYGADRDSYFLPTLSDLYADIIDKLGIKKSNIITEDFSDGKYDTTIEFENNSSICVRTKASYNYELLAENIKSIYEEYQKLQKEGKFMNKYESIIIMKPTISQEEKNKKLNEYKEFLETLSDKPVKVEDLGVKKLAYEVQKNKEGSYTIFNFAGKREDIGDLERRYRLDDNVIKFITIKQEQEEELEDTESIDDEDMEM